jgi:hypothetical protein
MSRDLHFPGKTSSYHLVHHLLVQSSAMCAGRFPLSILLMTTACSGSPQIVPLVRVAGLPEVQALAGSSPLEVVSRSTAIPDPLPVRGSNVVYGEVERALGTAVSMAAGPWADLHRNDPVALHGGWTVLVEMVGADAELEAGGRVVVGIEVRATLRTRSGNVFLGQTQLGCREGGLVSADQGAPVVYRCMLRLGRDLAGWLGGGVRLDPPAPETG